MIYRAKWSQGVTDTAIRHVMRVTRSGGNMAKYKYSMPPRVKSMVEWQLEHYWQDKQNLEQFWRDSLPSATPNYSGIPGGSDVGRNAEDTALRIISSPYVAQAERSVKAIEKVLSATNDIDKRLVRLVYWQQTYTVEGAANVLHMNRATAYRHLNDVLQKIALELGYISL